MKRQSFPAGRTTIALFFLLGAPILLAACSDQLTSDQGDQAPFAVGIDDKDPAPVAPFSQAMTIPPVLAPTSRDGNLSTYDLHVQAGTTSFFPDIKTYTWGYNGAFMGPTIRLRRGEQVAVNIKNELVSADPQRPVEFTNVHWHGMRIPASADGPHHDIDVGQTFTSRFTVIQPAATLWYHPHTKTSSAQVYQGLLGMLYIDDEVSDALALPRDYGVNDFPLIFQDKRFQESGRLAYMDRRGDEDRMLGSRMLVNGAIAPYLSVPRGWVRLRLLNGSDARRYNIAFEDGRSFQLIGTDGGLLPRPISVTSLMLTPAERAEILVDFSGDRDSGRVRLVNNAFPVYTNEIGPLVAPYNVLVNTTRTRVVSPFAMGRKFSLMEFQIGRPANAITPSQSLVAMAPIPEAESKATRHFDIEKGAEGTINQQLFDMNRVDAQVTVGDTEIWEITNHAPGFSHSFHIHGIQFQVLSRTVDGKAAALAPLETGWKDTVMVYPSETLRVIGRFNDLDGLYMFHCHIFVHEDKGMMGTFFVGPPGVAPPTAATHMTHGK